VGEKPESQKARTGAGGQKEGSNGGKGGSKGERAQHKTAWSRRVGFVFHLKEEGGGGQGICSRKGFSLGNPHPPSTKAGVSVLAASLL